MNVLIHDQSQDSLSLSKDYIGSPNCTIGPTKIVGASNPQTILAAGSEWELTDPVSN